MIILGIETSCDETAIAIVEFENGKIKILSNIVSSQVKIHSKFGGVVPQLAAREHAKNLKPVFELAFKEAEKKPGDIDLIAVTQGPGLIIALILGTTFAKTLAWVFKKPIIGINHLEGHIYSNWLKPIGKISNFQFPISKLFPALNLIVSGGHTMLVFMEGHGKYKLLGETLDDAVGEAFDKVARLLELGYPGGPLISKLAEKGNPEAFDLPRPMLDKKNYNFSFSGLKTSVLYLLRKLEKESASWQKADVAASFQKAVIDVLINKTIKAAKEYKVKAVLLSGGVSANKLLREELVKECEKNRIKCFVPDLTYTGDNAAMIAVAGCFKTRTMNHELRIKDKLGWKNIKPDANLKLVV